MTLLPLCLLALLLTAATLTITAAPFSPSTTSSHLSSHSSHPLAAQPTAHIFLIAGQSNSVGYNSDPFTADGSINPRILQLSCCTANLTSLPPSRCYLNVSSDPLQPCDIGSHVSFARTFAKSLLSSLPSSSSGDVVVLVPSGISGTGFIDGVWPAYTGSGFQAAIAMLIRTWQLLGEGGSEHTSSNTVTDTTTTTTIPHTTGAPTTSATPTYTPSFDGVLWHQGTCDAGDNSFHVAANSSYHLHHNLIPLVAALRNTSLLPFTSHTLPFVLSQMLPSWMDNATHPERGGVKQAIAMLTQYVQYTGLADSYGLLGDPVFLSGSDHEVVHFTARSQRILGKRYYAAYQAALVNYAEQPPASSSSSSTHEMLATLSKVGMPVFEQS